VLLAAGLEGIEKGYELPPPAEKNVFDMTPKERARLGICTLPEDLWEAINLAERGEFLRRVLGDHVFTKFIQNKKIEWEGYRAHVTGWELERYLAIL
jgi:glutamine synthetase